MANFEPIQPYRLAREIATRISEMILSGEIPPGTRLPPERELAQKFNVSRPTLREAIHVLEALRLVEVRQGNGTFVSKDPSPISSGMLERMLQKDPKLLLEVIEARYDFEVRNAELAAKNATDSDIEHLAEVVREMEEDVAKDQPGFERDIDFHLTVAEATQNRIRLFITTSVFLAHFEILLDSRVRITRKRSNAEELLRQHRDIYLAIRDRDPAKAAEAMRLHLEYAYNINVALRAGAP